ncbi:MAG: hypothetical protein A2X49_13635 [Lentisphaerae bacterium GWF2_52_8]|nr:MAG: hypothetical protein A2X49_13635 [Lentisphaerae bacterium GWF2_52_8]
MTTKKALSRVIFWVALSLLFNVGIYFFMGQQRALEFFGGYIIELSLSLDNLFVFLMIFSCFGIGQDYQRRVLNYGIIGAVVLRLIFIVLGVAMVKKFEWILYVFGAILIVSGIRMILPNKEQVNFKESKLLKWMSKLIPFTENLEGERFFIRKEKVLYATPLFAILVLIESSDVIFAIDSIPAVFSVTTNTFIVYTSNICAILGLRSMYFLLQKLHSAFSLVKYGVALILIFTGVKLAILMFHIEIPLLTSIAVIMGLLLASIVASVLFKRRELNTAA